MKAKPCGDLRAHDVLEVLDYIEFFLGTFAFLCFVYSVRRSWGEDFSASWGEAFSASWGK